MATNTGEYMIPRRGTGPGETGPIMVEVYAQTDVGQTRDHNEDVYLVANLSGGAPLHFDGVIDQKADAVGTLFMVADGMGGAAAGEIASATAVDVVLRHLRDELAGRSVTAPADFVEAVSHATEVANWAIFRYAHGRPELRGMGTTATIVGLLGDTLYLAQVGDSRAYLVREGRAIQITKDQSLMQKLIDAGELTEEEAAQSERRNIILQALGPEPSVAIDLTHQRVRDGDVLVLCSDGLSGVVRAEEIAGAVVEEPDLAMACDRLITLANDRGGPDNITVVTARFTGPGLSASSDDADEHVGHRVFTAPPAARPVTPASSGTQAPDANVSAPPAATEVPATPATEPPSAAMADADETRRRRGERYSRILLFAGVALAAFWLWRFLARLSQ